MSTLSRELLIEIVKQIGIGINFCRSYPKDHPGLEPIVSRLLGLFKEIPSDRSEISFCLIENIILFEGERFESEKLPIVKSIANIFNKLGVRSVSFDPSLTAFDIKAFFNTMASTQADLQDYGNIEAIIKSSGAEHIRLNELEYGVVSSKGGKVKIDWEIFLKTLHATKLAVSDEETKKELTHFLTDVVGLKGGEPEELQTKMIVTTLEKLCNVVVEKFGPESWGEYSLIFTRILATLSPNIKKRIAQIRTDNRRLADLIRNLLPTLSDDTLIEIISTRAMATEEETVDPDVIEVLKRLTGPRLVNLLPQLKEKLPLKVFEEITLLLSRVSGFQESETKVEDLSSEELEQELRKYFPSLRSPEVNTRLTTINSILEFTNKLIDLKRTELIKLVVDRFDALSDGEKEIQVFSKVIDALKQIYLKCKDVGLREIYDNISKRIGKHLLRTGKEFVERKAVVVNMIGEIRDLNYITELITILWEPGIFNEAREALIKFANDAVEPLLGVLKDAEDRSVRMKILDVLVRMGNVIVPSVLKLLGDQEWYIRRNGLYLLGQLKAEDTIDAIGEMIKDENELVQVEAVCALGNISGEKVKPYLREALNSKYLSVSLEAARYLPRAEVRSVIPRFLKMLERRKRIPDKKEETMRRDVIRVIGEIGGDEVIETLVQVIKDRSLLGTDLLLTTKEVAIEALGQIGTPKALDALNELALSSDEKIVSMVEGVITKIKFKSQQLDHK